MSTANIGTLPTNYYFFSTGASSHVTNYITEQTQLQPNQQYTLASGTATISTPVTGSYTNDYVNIKYFLKNTSGIKIQSGDT